ncbi:MAG: hypothetical protein KDA37_04505 [Planctomycetales bacterium]|nr:hypothetical protein [Planctomycetales bacterium]
MRKTRLKCGLRTADWGGSALRLYRIPHPELRTRSAITLLEVLISMAVLTIGVLGVAALFPVGAHYSRKSDVYDRADAAAQSAFSDAVTRGLLDPDRWVSYEAQHAVNSSYNPLGTTGRFNRPFAAFYRQQLGLVLSQVPALVNQQRDFVAESGSVYFIDPLSVARGMSSSTSTGPEFQANRRLGGVPASTDTTDEFLQAVTPYWAPWIGSRPVQRVSVSALPNTGLPLLPAVAERILSINDDLATDLGDDPDKPAQQMMATATLANSGQTVSTNRIADQNYEYLLSVAPRSPEASRAVALGGRAESYDVSAVVFARRPRNRYLDNDPDFGGIETIMRAERWARASVLLQGLSGGEVQLFQDNPNKDPISAADPKDRPWKSLRAGAYVFLFGPQPGSTAQRPLLFAQWYRVVSVNESKDMESNVGPAVGLRGPDWPWGGESAVNETTTADPPAALNEDLRMIIFDGAVAVHTRTLRLDNGAAWSMN